MKIAGIFLAAGGSRRFDGIKQLAKIGEQCLLEKTYNQFKLAGLDDHCVVLGAHHQQVSQCIYDKANIVVNANWPQGMSSSLQAGLTFLLERHSGELSHVLIGLADQVELSFEQYQQLINLQREQPEKIIAAKYAQTVGVPASFPQQFFTSLLQLDSQQGAKQLLRMNTTQTVTCEIPQAVYDIDTQQDFSRWHVKHNNDLTEDR